MTKLEQTNSVLELINEGLNNGKLNNEETIGMALLDIAKSLAIIADGTMTQNEQMEKIESDLSRLEHSYSSKWYQVPYRH